MDERLNRAIFFIHRKLTDKITVSEFALEACTSYRNLLRLFKKYMKVTPFRYIEQLKIQKSLEYIMVDKKCIQDISTELGYKNYETFSKAFYKEFHISPGDLKEILRAMDLSNKENGAEVTNLEILSIDHKNLSDLMNHFYNNLSEKCNQECRTFIASRKPISINSNFIKVRNKYYVARF